MIWFEKGPWDVIANLGEGGAGAISMGAIIIYLQQRYKNGNGNGNGYGKRNGGCVLANQDISKLRGIEISDQVVARIQPDLERQTELLEEIRDGVRDLKH